MRTLARGIARSGTLGKLVTVSLSASADRAAIGCVVHLPSDRAWELGRAGVHDLAYGRGVSERRRKDGPSGRRRIVKLRKIVVKGTPQGVSLRDPFGNLDHESCRGFSSAYRTDGQGLNSDRDSRCRSPGWPDCTGSIARSNTAYCNRPCSQAPRPAVGDGLLVRR
jgi:hypothetical protein